MSTGVSIVHTGRDREVAARIASLLRRQGINIWIDPQPLVWGRTPTKSVIESAENSKIVLYLCSPAILEQPWEQGEGMTLQHQLRLRSNPVLIPVIVSPCDLPPLLSNVNGFDLTSGDFDQRVAKLANIILRLLKERTIFICHSSRDKDSVRPLVHSLQRRRNLSVWYDEASLRPGSIIRRGIEAGISKADYLIAVLSSNTIDTIGGWIGFELDLAYEKERLRNQKEHYFVIPVIIEHGIVVPGWLSTKVHVDLTRGFNKGVSAIVKAISVDTPVE